MSSHNYLNVPPEQLGIVVNLYQPCKIPTMTLNELIMKQNKNLSKVKSDEPNVQMSFNELIHEQKKKLPNETNVQMKFKELYSRVVPAHEISQWSETSNHLGTNDLKNSCHLFWNLLQEKMQKEKFSMVVSPCTFNDSFMFPSWSKFMNAIKKRLPGALMKDLCESFPQYSRFFHGNAYVTIGFHITSSINSAQSIFFEGFDISKRKYQHYGPGEYFHSSLFKAIENLRSCYNVIIATAILQIPKSAKIPNVSILPDIPTTEILMSDKYSPIGSSFLIVNNTEEEHFCFPFATVQTFSNGIVYHPKCPVNSNEVINLKAFYLDPMRNKVQYSSENTKEIYEAILSGHKSVFVTYEDSLVEIDLEKMKQSNGANVIFESS